MSRLIKSCAADDRGVVLVAVMGAIMLISVLATGGYLLASQALHESVKHTDASRAFQVASSGMDRELASFSTTNFDSGSTGYVKSGSTPDGSYQLTVSQDGGVSFMFTMRCVGTAAGEVSTVETTFFYMDLWAMSIGAGDSPDFGSGAQWNGRSTIHGPLYINSGGEEITFNSNPELHRGPLFVDGSIDFGGAVSFFPAEGDSKYRIFASGTVKRNDVAKTEVFTSCPKIDLPWLDDEYFEGMKSRAMIESSDNILGTGDQTNEEVDPHTGLYIGPKAPGATTEYKVINAQSLPNQTLAISSSTPSFGKFGPEWPVRDDFAFDQATGTLYVDGVVFVDGNVHFGVGVTGYQGNGIIVATGDITVRNNNGNVRGSLRPRPGNGLTLDNCLGLASKGDVTVRDSEFEGVVFSNGSIVLARQSNNTTAIFRGVVHAHGIQSDDPANSIYMADNFAVALLPEGMPGSSSDPRGPEYSSQGMLVPGTWIRR